MKQFLRFLKSYRTHFILWSIYITYECLLIGVFYDLFGKLENYVTHFCLNVSLFYINLWLLDRLKINRSQAYFKILLISVLEILIYIPLLALLNHFFTEYNQPTTSSQFGIDHRFVFGAIYRSLFFILMSTGFWFLKSFLMEKQISEHLEKERLKAIIERETIKTDLVQAKNAYMRSQINPHFLFNTMSFVQSRVYKTDAEAGELLLLLAQMMRYTISLDQKETFSSLSTEIEQVENLITLFQIKENYCLSVHFDYNDAALRQKILPLTLLTLCENLFKHGVLNDPACPAIISVNCNSNKIVITTENKIAPVSNPLSSKTGLKNLEERLKQHYDEDAILLYTKKGMLFIAKLEIPVI